MDKQNCAIDFVRNTGSSSFRSLLQLCGSGSPWRSVKRAFGRDSQRGRFGYFLLIYLGQYAHIGRHHVGNGLHGNWR